MGIGIVSISLLSLVHWTWGACYKKWGWYKSRKQYIPLFFMLRGICFDNQVENGMVEVLIKNSKVAEDQKDIYACLGNLEWHTPNFLLGEESKGKK